MSLFLSLSFSLSLSLPLSLPFSPQYFLSFTYLIFHYANYIFILYYFAFSPIILSSHNPHSSTSTGGAGAGGSGAGTLTTTRGVHFTNPIAREGEETPHGMPCVREVLRFLIAIINPKDK